METNPFFFKLEFVKKTVYMKRDLNLFASFNPVRKTTERKKKTSSQLFNSSYIYSLAEENFQATL